MAFVLDMQFKSAFTTTQQTSQENYATFSLGFNHISNIVNRVARGLCFQQTNFNWMDCKFYKNHEKMINGPEVAMYKVYYIVYMFYIIISECVLQCTVIQCQYIINKTTFILLVTCIFKNSPLFCFAESPSFSIENSSSSHWFIKKTYIP